MNKMIESIVESKLRLRFIRLFKSSVFQILKHFKEFEVT